MRHAVYGYIAYGCCIIGKLHLFPLAKNSGGGGAWYACSGAVSKIGGGGTWLDGQVQEGADVTGSWLDPACTYWIICNWVMNGGVWLNEHVESNWINGYKIRSITLIGQKVLINGWYYGGTVHDRRDCAWLMCKAFTGVHWLLDAVLNTKGKGLVVRVPVEEHSYVTKLMRVREPESRQVENCKSELEAHWLLVDEKKKLWYMIFSWLSCKWLLKGNGGLKSRAYTAIYRGWGMSVLQQWESGGQDDPSISGVIWWVLQSDGLLKIWMDGGGELNNIILLFK